MYAILIYIFRITSTVCSNPNTQGMQNKKMQTLLKIFKDCWRTNKKYSWLCSIRKTISSLALNIICLGQNKLLSRNLKSIVLTSSVWQNRRQPQTYKFKSYLSMCPWQIVTLHVYIVHTLTKAVSFLRKQASRLKFLAEQRTHSG
jgi:hypothetical protein